MGLRQTAEKREFSLTGVRAGVATAKKQDKTKQRQQQQQQCNSMYEDT